MDRLKNQSLGNYMTEKKLVSRWTIAIVWLVGLGLGAMLGVLMSILGVVS